MTGEKQSVEFQLQELADLKAALDQHAIVAITNAYGVITHVNDKFCTASKYSRAELLGQNHRILNSGLHSQEFFAALWQTINRGQTWKGEIRNTAADGSFYWVDATIVPFMDEDGKPRRFVSICAEITERKREEEKRQKLEEDYRQAQKLESIGQLAGGVAHDFNNILAVIQMQSDLIKGSAGITTDQRGFADEISLTVQRASALTRQLLLFSRREVFQPRDLDLSDSILNTAKMLKRTLGENVQVQLKLASEQMLVHADPGMMDQLLLNLAVNARDAMPGGGRLIVETLGVELDEAVTAQSTRARPGSFVCMSVTDTGTGIPLEILPKIFEPFFTTKGVGKGTGLGLATVFGVVEQHQGWIDVKSKVGHGTTFSVYLPRLIKNSISKPSTSELKDIRGGDETILLAEDDPALRASVRRTLSRLGYRILEAPTGVKALEVWRQNRREIGLLVTDLMMPDGMTGNVLAQKILEDNPELNVIYMSGYSADIVDNNLILQEGANFLSKPFQSIKLAKLIREKLDARN